MDKSLDILNLQNDAVFKIFFSQEKNKFLLISFLNAVLSPKLEIMDVEILHSNLQKEMVDEKESFLDLHVKLKDGSTIDVEMQVAGHAGFRKRILYYWAKLHRNQFNKGSPYPKLAPTLSICLLSYNEFVDNIDEVHSVFELRERNRGVLYLSDLELHFLELKKYKLWKKKKMAKGNRNLELWVRFFQLQKLSEQEINEVLEDTTMTKALKALEELSQDPSVRELAEMREMAAINRHIIISETKAEGIAIGEARGEARGEAKGKAEGKAELKAELIKNALESNMTIEQIASLFKMTVEEVEKLK